MTTTHLLAPTWEKPWGRTHIGLLDGRHVRGLRFSLLQGKRLPLLVKYISPTPRRGGLGWRAGNPNVGIFGTRSPMRESMVG